ncbi:MAG: hypothetical protein HYT12_01580 [Candidatus Liptonbacteria bacterium]|nr:hypothetical protein [Candidatus Liptonbacteria bacterium]
MKLFNTKKIFFILILVFFSASFFASPVKIANAQACDQPGSTCTTSGGEDGKCINSGQNNRCIANVLLGSTQKIGPATAASVATKVGLGALSGIASFFNWLITLIAGGLIQLVVWLIEVALGLNSNILAMPAVQIGWVLVRDVANLGFVLGIIVIAFATIIRQQSYGIKNLLVKLIVAAVLVNFSLPIAGLALDAAGIPTQYFIDQIATHGSPGEFALTLAGAFDIQKIPEASDSDRGAALRALGDGTVAVSNTFFSAIFSLLILITLAAVAIMLFMRFVAVGLLLVLMPMAILFSVFPKFSGNFHKWLEQFLRWTFFAPAVLFFIYLAIYTVKVQQGFFGALSAKLQADPSGVAAALTSNLKLIGSNPLYTIGNMALMIGLTMGGLFVANSLSLMGGMGVATAAQGYAQRWTKKILKAPVVAGGAAGAYAWERAKTVGGAEVGPDGKAKAPYLQRASSYLATIPGVGRAFRGIAEGRATATKDIGAEVEKMRGERFDNMSKDYRFAIGNKFTRVANPRVVAANALSMAGKGEFREFLEKAGPETIDIFLNALRKTGTSKNLLSSNPELAPEFGEDLKKVMPRVPGESYEKFSEKTFELAKDAAGNIKSLADNMAKQIVLFGSPGGFTRIAQNAPQLVGPVMQAFEELRKEMQALKTTKIDAGTATDEEKQNYNRFLTQRSLFYQNYSYQSLANAADLAAFNATSRRRRRGGGGAGGGGGSTTP